MAQRLLVAKINLAARSINEHTLEDIGIDMKKFHFPLGGALFLIATATCAAQTDTDFVVKTATSGTKEVEVGRTAVAKAKSAAVKNFARRMIADHTKAGNKLKMLAAKKNITLPVDIDAEAKPAVEQLAALSDNTFDRAYMEMMVGDHEKAVAEFENETTAGADAEVKAVAAKTLPTLKMHLQARAIDRAAT